MGRKTQNLYTKYYDTLDESRVFSEYPRQQLVRDSYISLNGIWEYAVSKEKSFPRHYDGEILVPYPIESLLSKVHKTLAADDYLIYRKTFTLPDSFKKARILLHFGAVDQQTWIYVNNRFLAEHIGGYFPFSVDITDSLDRENELTVIVRDPQNSSYRAYGKQSLNPKNIWYTPVTGIFQSVWMESVPENYITDFEITCDLDMKKTVIKIKALRPDQAIVSIYHEGTLISEQATCTGEAVFYFETVHPWSPEDPHLYDFRIKMGDDDVTGYFAFRKFSIGEGQYGKCILLNNHPYFLTGVLDQGYYSDGLYTPASDQALIDDIMTMKQMRFNTLRKHIKIEPLRWYYHCDRLGMIVWQDIVSGGNYNFLQMTAMPTIGIKAVDDTKNLKVFGRNSEESQKAFEEELKETVHLLYNSPSVGLWTIFNEGWGQFQSRRFYDIIKEIDRTRIIDSASGWFDQGGPDLASKHIYFGKIQIKKEDRPVVLSEFGGYSLKVPEHSYSLTKEYGYRKYRDMKSLEQAYQDLYENEIIPNLKNGLCACIYTQLSDVEEETNGILTYDRKVCKLNPETVRKINEQLTLE